MAKTLQLEEEIKELRKQLKTAQANALHFKNDFDREVETFKKYKEENLRLNRVVVRVLHLTVFGVVCLA